MTTKRILVLCQPHDFGKVIKLSLEMAHWKVLIARSVSEALISLTEDQPDAVLLDVDSLNSDGINLVKRLQPDAAAQQIPIVVIVDRAGQLEQKQLYQLGVAAVIPRLLNPATLATQIASALKWDLPSLE